MHDMEVEIALIYGECKRSSD